LEQTPSGTWLLSHASAPQVSKTQPTSSIALKAAAAEPTGHEQDQLLGVGVFSPASHKGQRVAVKGVLLKDAKVSRINVTSLQTLSSTCF